MCFAILQVAVNVLEVTTGPFVPSETETQRIGTKLSGVAFFEWT